MKSTLSINSLTLAAFLAAGLSSTLLKSNAAAATRPLTDLLSQQGKWCIKLDREGFIDCQTSGYTNDTAHGGCLLFVPPVPNYIGWSDPFTGTCAAFDYAGLADAALGGRLGTSISGTINEIPQRDGSVIVRVVLHASNAMAFAVEGFDFTGPLIFGNRASEILAGAKPSVGSSTLVVVFRNPAPGAPLPDLQELLICRFNDLISLSFVGEANGFLPNGQPGQLQVTQVGLISVYSKANAHSRVALDAFPAEHISVRPTSR